MNVLTGRLRRTRALQMYWSRAAPTAEMLCPGKWLWAAAKHQASAGEFGGLVNSDVRNDNPTTSLDRRASKYGVYIFVVYLLKRLCVEQTQKKRALHSYHGGPSDGS